MQLITAPSLELAELPGVFLAGGITGSPDWQTEMIQLLDSFRLTVFNPRRSDWPEAPAEVQRQIEWEYSRLHEASAVLFWFPRETACPIALYELGAAGEREQTIFVGCHYCYPRRQDLEIQLGLCRPEVKLVYHLWDLFIQVRKWASRYPTVS
jgi:hypothetical protein